MSGSGLKEVEECECGEAIKVDLSVMCGGTSYGDSRI